MIVLELFAGTRSISKALPKELCDYIVEICE